MTAPSFSRAPSRAGGGVLRSTSAARGRSLSIAVDETGGVGKSSADSLRVLAGASTPVVSSDSSR